MGGVSSVRAGKASQEHRLLGQDSCSLDSGKEEPQPRGWSHG